jgi:FMNH2-dependent dimethyl sulfone monooxygenase
MKKNFKIGLFGINSSGGLSLTRSKERWTADWKEIIKLVKYADQNKFDFILPLSKWKGWGGETNPAGLSYETFNFASLLLPITKKIQFYSTVHVPFVHPVYAAKATRTITSAYPQRYGLNLVCGLSQVEHEMFYKINKNDLSKKFKYASEWIKIFNKLIYSNSNFSFKSNFFNIKNASIYSTKLEMVPLISAAYSDEGRKFALSNCKILFTAFDNFEKTKKNNKILLERAKTIYKKIQLYTPIHIICRKTESEANEFHIRYSVKEQDSRAVYNFIQNFAMTKKKTLFKIMKSKSQLIASSCGFKIIKGNPKQVGEQLRELKNAHFSGAAFTFVNYLNEIKFFNEKVLSKNPLK